MEKNYNYERKKLMLPEYGRHIHEMVDYLNTIQDRDLRNHQAQVVIEVMGNLNPVLRDTADFKHKLWDHLFIISDFQLDVDSPYPLPSANLLAPTPDRIEYPRKKIAHKQYGKHVEHIISELVKVQDPEAKTSAALNLAKYMRAKSYEYNQEYPNNEIILNDLRRLSKGEIVMDENAMNNSKIEYKQTQTNHKGRKNNSNTSQNNSKATQRQNKNGGKKRQNNRPQYK